MRRPRRNHSPAFKAKVALAAIEGNATLRRARATLRRPPQSDHRMATPTRRQRRRRVRDRDRAREPTIDVKALHAKIGQQALELDFLANALGRSPGPTGKR